MSLKPNCANCNTYLAAYDEYCARCYNLTPILHRVLRETKSQLAIEQAQRSIKATRIEALEAENAMLREQVQALQDQIQDLANPGPTCKPEEPGVNYITERAKRLELD